MGTKKRLEPIDEAVADELAKVVEVSGQSYRDLREGTGMSINRIGIILRKEPPPATVGEVGLIANQLGLTASEILGAADRKLESGVGLAPLGGVSSKNMEDSDLSDDDIILAASDLDFQKEIEGWQGEP